MQNLLLIRNMTQPVPDMVQGAGFATAGLFKIAARPKAYHFFAMKIASWFIM
jgi:hypothetical protein